MGEIPTWLSVIGVLFTISITLATAGALYRVSDLRREIGDLTRRNTRLVEEIGDHERRETALEHEVEILQVDRDNCARRIQMLEDLVTKRADDAELRAGIAELKRVVDEEMRVMLVRIEGEVRALNPATGAQDGGTAHA